MGLPKQEVISYDVTIPSTKKKAKFRHFLVSEEKALLLAQQSENPVTMLETLKNVIQSCTYNTIDVDKLAMFDIEYLFCQIRSKSVGEIIELIFKCDTCHDSKAQVEVKIDVSKIDVTFDPKHTNKIALWNNVGIVMKYPDIELMKKIESANLDDVNVIFLLLKESIDFIYDGDVVFYSKDQKADEIDQFVNNLSHEQFGKIQTFFQTIPRLEKIIHFICPVCQVRHEKVISGLQNFF